MTSPTYHNDPIPTKPFYSFFIKPVMTLGLFQVTVADKCGGLDSLLNNALNVQLSYMQIARQNLMAGFQLCKGPSHSTTPGTLVKPAQSGWTMSFATFAHSTFPKTGQVRNGKDVMLRIHSPRTPFLLRDDDCWRPLPIIGYRARSV